MIMLTCPGCGSEKVSTEVIRDIFYYGSVKLSADIPLRTCQDCEEQFLDNEAEELHHGAVCEYLKVMKPGEIQSLMTRLGCSSKELAARLIVDPERVEQWLRGASIQSPLIDQHLRVLNG